MNVSPIGHARGISHSQMLANAAHQIANRKTADPRSVGQTSVDAPVAAVAPEDTAPPAGTEGGRERARGVLRLLEAGHFKGVADVRLRINFFDELSAGRAAAAGAAVQDEARHLVETVTASAEELSEALALEPEMGESLVAALGEFDTAVQAAAAAFTSDARSDTEDLAGALRAAFDALVVKLREMLPAPVLEPEPVPNPDPTEIGAKQSVDAARLVAARDTGVATDSASTEAADLGASKTAAAPTAAEPGFQAGATDGVADRPTSAPDGVLAPLIAAFEEALADLLTSIESVARLPDPSPPNGHGAAYAKFLAQYNALRGVPSGLDEQV